MVGDAIENLGDIKNLDPYVAQMAGAFHEETPSISDEDMMAEITGTPEDKARIINTLYTVLARLKGSDEMGRRVALVIENFLTKHYKPIQVPSTPTELPGQIRPGVVKRPGREKPPEAELTPIKDWSKTSPGYRSYQDRLDDAIDRRRSYASELYNMLVTAGVLERVPSFNERAARLAERKYAWAAFEIER